MSEKQELLQDLRELVEEWESFGYTCDPAGDAARRATQERTEELNEVIEDHG